MRNLKKVLSLALAMMMLVGMMSISAGAVSFADFTDKDKVVHADAVAMLTELNIVNGTDKGTFNPDGVVTRAAMAKMICVTLNRGTDNGAAFVGAKASFSDTDGHWAEGYIEYCSALGIIAGDGNGKFNPDASVTGSQAAKMILTALGYNAVKEGLVGAAWQLKTTVLASSLGVFDTIDTNPTANFSRDDAAQLIYNGIINTNTVGYSTVTGALVVNTTTLAGEKFGLLTVKGILLSNEYASLDGVAVEKAGYSMLDLSAIVAADKTIIKVSTSKALLGQEVQLYVKGSFDAGFTTLTYTKVYGTAVATAKNVVKTSSAAMDAAAFTKFVGTGYSINATSTYANFGVAAANPTTNAAGTKVTLVDNNNDKVYEYCITETYTFDKVTSVTTVAGVTTVKTTGVAGGFVTTAIVGDSNLVKGDYVNLALIDGMYHVYKAASVTGAMTSFADDVSMTVGGVTYTTATTPVTVIVGVTAASAYDLSTNLNATGVFYLDVNGNVIATTAVTKTLDYAVCMDTAALGGVGAVQQVKLGKTDGTTAIYSIASTSTVGVPVNGTIYSYAIKADGTVNLTAATVNVFAAGAVAAKATTYTLTTPAATAYATSNTVFVFYGGTTPVAIKGAANVGAYTTVAVTNVITSTAGTVTLLDYVFVNLAAPGLTSTATYAYVTNVVPVVTMEGTTAYYTYKAAIDGAIVDLKTTTAAATAGLNTYATTGTSTTLSAVAAGVTGTNTMVKDATVTYVDPNGTYVLIGTTVVNLTSTTKIYDVTTAGAGAASTLVAGQTVTFEYVTASQNGSVIYITVQP